MRSPSVIQTLEFRMYYNAYYVIQRFVVAGAVSLSISAFPRASYYNVDVVVVVAFFVYVIVIHRILFVIQ